MVAPSRALSRDNFGSFRLGRISKASGCGIIDTIAARVLILLVLETALLPAGSAIRSAEQWNKPSAN